MTDEDMDWEGPPRTGIGIGFPSAGAGQVDGDGSDSEEFERPSFGRNGLNGNSFAPPAALSNDTDPYATLVDADTGLDASAGRGIASPSRKRRFKEDKSAGGDFGTYKSSFSSTNASTKPSKKAGAGFGGANSFAARMMAKMGYKEGEGLGKEGTGRLAPIDAALRPQGAGLGAVKEKTKQAREEEKRVAALNGQALEEDSEEEDRRLKKERRRRRQEQGLSGAGSAPGGDQGKKTRYKTAAEIQFQSVGLTIPDSLKGLVDLSGQQTNFTPTSGKGVMVAQESEATKIARRARRDLEAYAEEWQTTKELKLQLEMDAEHMVVTMDQAEEHRKRAKEVVDVLADLSSLTLAEQPSRLEVTQKQWDELTDRLEGIELNLKNETQISDIREVALSAVEKLFKASMLEWNPLEDPKYLVENISRLQQILGAEVIRHAPTSTALVHHDMSLGSRRHSKRATSLYESMLYIHWLPKVRSALTNDWQVQESDNALNLLHAWRPILPEFILNHVLRQLVIPRLISAISSWKPSRKSGDIASPHHWLFPWVEFLPQSHLRPENGDGVAATLRRRIRSVLSSHPIREGVPAWLLSLRSLLFPQHILRQVATTALLPRLSAYLKDRFIIDPADQKVEPFEEVLAYRELFAPRSFAELLIARFFPRFFDSLHSWLTAEAPDYSEIEQWFKWWQNEEIPADLRHLPAIEAYWNAALGMISEALDLGEDAAKRLRPAKSFFPQPGSDDDGETSRDRRREGRHPGRTRRHKMEDGISHDHRNGKSRRNQRKDHPPSPRTETGARLVPEEITFRELLEEFCAEHGLLLIGTREAHPIHGAPLLRITADSKGRGGVVGYSQGDILYVRHKLATSDERVQTTWKPMGLSEKLVKEAGG